MNDTVASYSISYLSIPFSIVWVTPICYSGQFYAKQKHFGCKKLQGQSEAAIKWLYMQPNVWYLAKAKNYTEYKIGNLNAVW